jgi:hypothetical protein
MNKQIIRNIRSPGVSSSYFRNPVCGSLLPWFTTETIKCKKTRPREGALIGWSTFMEGAKPTFSYGRWYEETIRKKTKEMRLQAVKEFYNK